MPVLYFSALSNGQLETSSRVVLPTESHCRALLKGYTGSIYVYWSLAFGLRSLFPFYKSYMLMYTALAD